MIPKAKIGIVTQKIAGITLFIEKLITIEKININGLLIAVLMSIIKDI
jgi:hypothetical protein